MMLRMVLCVMLCEILCGGVGCVPLRCVALALETQEGRSMQSFLSASYVFSLCLPESITNT